MLPIPPQQSTPGAPSALRDLVLRIRRILPLFLLTFVASWLPLASLLNRWPGLSGYYPNLAVLGAVFASWILLLVKQNESTLQHELLIRAERFSARYSKLLWLLFACTLVLILSGAIDRAKPILLIVPGKDVLVYLPESGASPYALRIHSPQSRDILIPRFCRQIVAVAPNLERVEGAAKVWNEKVLSYASSRMSQSPEIASRLISAPVRLLELSLSKRADLQFTLEFDNGERKYSWVVYSGRLVGEDLEMIFLEDAWNHQRENL